MHTAPSARKHSPLLLVCIGVESLQCTRIGVCTLCSPCTPSRSTHASHCVLHALDERVCCLCAQFMDGFGGACALMFQVLHEERL